MALVGLIYIYFFIPMTMTTILMGGCWLISLNLHTDLPTHPKLPQFAIVRLFFSVLHSYTYLFTNCLYSVDNKILMWCTHNINCAFVPLFFSPNPPSSCRLSNVSLSLAIHRVNGWRVGDGEKTRKNVCNSGKTLQFGASLHLLCLQSMLTSREVLNVSHSTLFLR